MNGGGYFASCELRVCKSATLRVASFLYSYSDSDLITPIFKIARLFLLKIANVNNRGFGLYII